MKKIVLLFVVISAVFVTAVAQNSVLPRLGAAEYFVDTDPGPGSGTPLSSTDQSFDEIFEEISGTLSTGNLSIGAHTLYIRFKNSNG